MDEIQVNRQYIDTQFKADLHDRRLRKLERRILEYLAPKTRGEGFAWPRIRTLADLFEVSERTIQRALARLKNVLGWLRIDYPNRYDRRWAGGQEVRTSFYRITRPSLLEILDELVALPFSAAALRELCTIEPAPEPVIQFSVSPCLSPNMKKQFISSFLRGFTAGLRATGSTFFGPFPSYRPPLRLAGRP